MTQGEERADAAHFAHSAWGAGARAMKGFDVWLGETVVVGDLDECR